MKSKQRILAATTALILGISSLISLVPFNIKAEVPERNGAPSAVAVGDDEPAEQLVEIAHISVNPAALNLAGADDNGRTNKRSRRSRRSVRSELFYGMSNAAGDGERTDGSIDAPSDEIADGTDDHAAAPANGDTGSNAAGDTAAPADDVNPDSTDAINGGTENIPVGSGNQKGAYGVRILLNLDKSKLSESALEKLLADSNRALQFEVRWDNEVAKLEDQSRPDTVPQRSKRITLNEEELTTLLAGRSVSLGDYHLYYKDTLEPTHIWNFTVSFVADEQAKAYLRFVSAFNAKYTLLPKEGATPQTGGSYSNTLKPNQVINNKISVTFTKRNGTTFPSDLTGAFYRDGDNIMRRSGKVTLQEGTKHQGNNLDTRKGAYKEGDEDKVTFKLDGTTAATGEIVKDGKTYKYTVSGDILSGTSVTLTEKVQTIFKNPDDKPYGNISGTGADSDPAPSNDKIAVSGYLGDTLNLPTVGMKDTSPANKFAFIGWQPTPAATPVFDEVTVYEAQYKQKIIAIDDPDSTDTLEEGYVRIIFDADTVSGKGYFGDAQTPEAQRKSKLAFAVLKGTAQADVLTALPELTALTGYIKQTGTALWQPQLPATFTTDAVYTAQYIEADAVSKTPQPGYVKVIFTVDSAQGSLTLPADSTQADLLTLENGNYVTYVNPRKNLTLGALPVPTVTPQTGFVVADPLWLQAPLAATITTATTFTAQLTALPAVIPAADHEGNPLDKEGNKTTGDNSERPPVALPQGYVMVVFDATAEGEIPAGSYAMYYVNPLANITLADLPAPQLRAKAAYRVPAVPAWKLTVAMFDSGEMETVGERSLPEVITQNRLYTGQFLDRVQEVLPLDPNEPFEPENPDNPNNSTQTPQDFVRIVFDAAEGNFGFYVASDATDVDADAPADDRDGSGNGTAAPGNDTAAPGTSATPDATPGGSPIKKIAYDVHKDVLWQELANSVPTDYIVPPTLLRFANWSPLLPANDDIKLGELVDYPTRKIKIYTALYEDNDAQIGIPTAGYLRIQFVKPEHATLLLPQEHKALFEAEGDDYITYVKPDSITFAQLIKPQLSPAADYRKQTPEWRLVSPDNLSEAAQAGNLLENRVYEGAVEQLPSWSNTEIADFIKVVFRQGAHGSLIPAESADGQAIGTLNSGSVTVWVHPKRNVKLGDITPTIEAHEGYTVNPASPWDNDYSAAKVLDSTSAQVVEYTAQYLPLSIKVTPLDPALPFEPEKPDSPNNSTRTPQDFVRIIFDAAEGHFGFYESSDATDVDADAPADDRDGSGNGTAAPGNDTAAPVTPATPDAASGGIPIKKIAYDVHKDVLWQVFKANVPSVGSIIAPHSFKFVNWQPLIPADNVKVANAVYTVNYAPLPTEPEPTVQKPAKPTVDPIKGGDTEIKVGVPETGDTVEITLPDGTKVIVNKDEEGNWKIGKDITVPVVDGKLIIPVDGDKITVGDSVTVIVKDGDVSSDPTVVSITEPTPTTTTTAEPTTEPTPTTTEPTTTPTTTTAPTTVPTTLAPTTEVLGRRTVMTWETEKVKMQAVSKTGENGSHNGLGAIIAAMLILPMLPLLKRRRQELGLEHSER